MKLGSPNAPDDETDDRVRARRTMQEMFVFIALSAVAVAALGLSIWMAEEIDAGIAAVMYVLVLAGEFVVLFAWRHRKG